MKNVLIAVVSVAFLTPGIALATNGYFGHGYGMKAKGRAGVATAMTTDTFGGANNPASMVWVGDRVDVGIDWFSPQRNASRSGSLAGLDGSATSDNEHFFIPELGYNKMLSPGMSLGVTVYGNGGMNTDYPGDSIPAGSPVCGAFNPGGGGGPYNLLCGSGRLGVDLIQLVVAPTFAVKVAANHSIGISPLLGYQRFKAEGLQGFVGFTQNPAGFASDNRLTNRGHDGSYGWGVRVGWMGKFADRLTVGAAYATKMKMQKFDKYSDLFADQGGFDLPENYNIGVAFAATPSLTIAADYQRINYSGIDSVGHPSTNTGNAVAATGFTVGSLGCSSCRGFGWGDVNVVKLGAEYQLNPALTLRAGYGHTDNPIQARDVTFNIIAPGVVQDHVTLGFTYKVGQSSEITVAYMHAFKKSVTGSSLFNSFGVPAGNETIEMS